VCGYPDLCVCGAKPAGPIITTEMDEQMEWWIRRVQRHAKSSARYLDERLQLNLQENNEVILECRGRIQGKLN
jgi:hypothetical protein